MTGSLDAADSVTGTWTVTDPALPSAAVTVPRDDGRARRRARRRSAWRDPAGGGVGGPFGSSGTAASTKIERGVRKRLALAEPDRAAVRACSRTAVRPAMPWIHRYGKSLPTIATTLPLIVVLVTGWASASVRKRVPTTIACWVASAR